MDGDEKDLKNRYHSIKRSMISIVLIGSLTPLLLVMAVIGYEFHTTYRAKVLAYMVQTVEKEALTIDGFLNEKLADIKVLTRLYSNRQLKDSKFLANVLKHLQEQHGGVFVDLGLLDTQGKQLAYAGPFALGKADYGNAKWFKETMANQVYISDVFLGIRRLPHFVVAVKSESAGESRILRATIDFVAFNHLIEDIRLGKTGMAFIINREGEFQTQPKIDVTSYIPVLQDFIWEKSSRASRKGWAAGKTDRSRAVRPVGIFTDKNPDYGKTAIYVTTLLKNDAWALVYQQDESDAYASLYRARRISLTVCLLGVILIILIATYLSRRVVQRLTEGARARELMSEKIVEAGKLASIGELAAGIAHEINNPVAIMVEESGWIEDILDDLKSDDIGNLTEIRNSVNQIKKQGRRCKDITHKLLSFARKTDPGEKEIQLNDLVREMKELSEQRAKYENIKFEMDLAEDLPNISVSASEIPQVLLNLINNAIDAIDHKEGGQVTIRTRMEGEDVLLEVADTGQGIPEAIKKRLFDPFFTTKAVGKGTGLGLSICHGIISKMGGRITVDSTVGVGTTFQIYIPIKKRAQG
ncbi:MAG: ATP-binding protein [Elusimicrobiota bacterium]